MHGAMGLGSGLGMGLDFLAIGIMYSYITMIITLVIAAYLMSGVDTAKSCIKVFSLLQFLAVVIGFAMGFEVCVIAVISAIPLYVIMLVLWKFCKAKANK